MCDWQRWVKPGIAIVLVLTALAAIVFPGLS